MKDISKDFFRLSLMMVKSIKNATEKDIEKKVFYSSKIWESFGINQKGKCYDRRHQPDKNTKAD